MAAIQKKLVMVSDGVCGKTRLLIVFSKDQFPELYVSMVFESRVADMDGSGQKSRESGFVRPAGQRDYDRWRPLSYPNTDVI